MINEHSETARQRAARIWRNHQIQQEIDTPEPITTPEPYITEAQLNAITARFRNEIRDIIKERTHKSLLHYLILKRLKRNKPDGK
jgi:hypothetical protein